MSRIGQPRAKHNVQASLPPPAGFYSWSANLGKKRKWSISVNNFTGTRYSARQAKSLAIYYRLRALTLARWPWFRHGLSTSPAHDSSPRFKRSFTLPALHTWTLFAWTPGQIISTTLRFNGGEGVDRRNIFIIAIHKPAPEKFLQLGGYLLLEIVGVVRR